MKRLITTLAILAVMVAVCITGGITIEKYTDEMENLIKRAAEYCDDDDFEKAAAAARVLEARWVNIEPRISLFINHDTVDTVGEAISRLEPLARAEDKSTFLAECRAAVITLMHIAEDERPSFFGVF